MSCPAPDAPGAGRARRRAELLDAADRVVRRDGPAASMASMAAEAGISKPILYRHFGDRDGLCAALADRYTDRLLGELRAALRADGDRRARVLTTVTVYLQAIERDPQVYRFLLHSDAAAATARRVRSFTQALAELLARGIVLETGVAARRAQVWAHGIVGMVQAAGDWWLESQPAQPAQPAPSAPSAQPALSAPELARELTEILFGAYERV